VNSPREEDAPASVVNADLGGDDAPSGPSSEEEAMFLAEQREAAGDEHAPPKVAQMDIEDEKSELPPMEDLIKRIPLATRETLEELFRARFITVKRVPKSALNN
jgi:hypothetical protein